MTIDSQLFVLLVVISTGLGNASCPSMCSCSIHSSGNEVDCGSRSLGMIPELSNDTYYINLNSNQIKDIAVQFCKALPMLQHLHLNSNQISEINENTFEDCNQLVNLDLSVNHIEYIHPATFRNLTSLNLLYLYNNGISTIEPFTFMNLPSLTHLHLVQNNISHIREQAFGYLPSLSYLYLSGNPLTCDCNILAFWSWLIERPSISIGSSAECRNGTLVNSLQSAVLDICNPYMYNCQCFNGGKEDDDAECGCTITNTCMHSQEILRIDRMQVLMVEEHTLGALFTVQESLTNMRPVT